MVSKKFLIILFAALVVIAIGTSAFSIFRETASPENNITAYSPTDSATQKPATQPDQNQDSQKVVEGCVITPYNQGQLEFDNAVSDLRSDLRGGAVCYFKINPNLPIYTFRLIGNQYNTIDRIEIIKGSENTVNQTLEADIEEPPLSKSEFFSAEDINFDGYEDIRLMNWWGATGNTGYVYWLFDPQKSLFARNNDLSNLSNPMPHPETKTITTYGVGGMAGMIYGSRTYKFDDSGKLILIREEGQDWVENKKYFLKTISELKNGEMVIISTEIVKDEQ